jgi:hypothetical protein
MRRRGRQTELLNHDGRYRFTLFVIVLKVLGDDDAPGVQNVSPGIRYAEGRTALIDCLVQEPVAADGLGTWIGKHGERDLFAVRERLENFHGVVTDRSQTKALGADGWITVFQLDELGFAEGSPIG